MTTIAPVRGPLSGPRSEFRRVVAGVPADPWSPELVADLVRQSSLGTPNVNTQRYNLGIVQVSDDVPDLDVGWTGRSLGDALYAGLLGLDPKAKGYPWPVQSLSQLPASVGTFRGVPIPPEAVPAAGTDGALAVHRPSTGQLWELWQARRTTAGWSAAWGGYVPNLEVARGSYLGGLGVCASGLIAASGVITIEEARAGVIEHAIGLAIPHVVGGRWSYPATRCDGSGTSTAPIALHEGRRFRLRADVDVAGLRGPADWRGVRRPLHPLAQAIARAAQQYGFIITDRATVLAISTEAGTVTKAMTGTDPWVGIRGGTAEYNLLAGFPWELLEALPFDYGMGLAA